MMAEEVAGYITAAEYLNGFLQAQWSTGSKVGDVSKKSRTAGRGRRGAADLGSRRRAPVLG
jgi:hypothetical protein